MFPATAFSFWFSVGRFFARESSRIRAVYDFIHADRLKSETAVSAKARLRLALCGRGRHFSAISLKKNGCRSHSRRFAGNNTPVKRGAVGNRE
jgi:hypothetical protein